MLDEDDPVERCTYKIAVTSAPVVVEFVGTFFLTLTIHVNLVAKNVLAPISIGAVLIALIYMGGHVSGGHYNPAVTVGVWLRGGLISARKVVAYCIVQFVAAFVGSLAGYSVTGKTFTIEPNLDKISLFQAVAIELFFTFLLVIVVLNVATTTSSDSKMFAGLTVGLTVTSAAATIGPYSGGAMNPAVAVACALLHFLATGTSPLPSWIYLVGNMLGGILAALFFRMTHIEEYGEHGAEAGPEQGGAYSPYEDLNYNAPSFTISR